MDSYTLVENGVVYTPDQVIDDGKVAFSDGRIIAIGREGPLSRLTRQAYSSG